MTTKTTITVDSDRLARFNGFRLSLSSQMGKDMTGGDVLDFLLDSVGWPK